MNINFTTIFKTVLAVAGCLIFMGACGSGTNHAVSSDAGHIESSSNGHIVCRSAGHIESSSTGHAVSSNKVQTYKLSVIKEYPHDVTSYTQGLFFFDNQMYESTGLNGNSTFRKVDLQTGKPLERINFNKKYFIEGSVVLDDELFILTWMNHVAFVYDAKTLKYKKTYSYPRDGWGLTTDGKNLIATDGSANIYILDKEFHLLKTLKAKLNGRAVRNLNELEYINGKLYANVYMSDLIVEIDPITGIVTGLIDCTGLLPENERTDDTDVLNGIAFNPENDKLYVTGKNWPKLYQVKFVKK